MATLPAPSTVALDHGPSLVCVEVKTEDPYCPHTLLDTRDIPWPFASELHEFPGPHYRARDMDKLLPALDSFLFQYNMRGWNGVQAHLRSHQAMYRCFYKGSGSARGLQVICRACSRSFAVGWSAHTPWNDPLLECHRRTIRSFFGFGTRGRAGQRIV